MTKKRKLLLLCALAILINIGVWLMGVYGIEVRIGSHRIGRHIGINEEETYISILGWFITISGCIALIVILYRNR